MERGESNYQFWDIWNRTNKEGILTSLRQTWQTRLNNIQHLCLATKTKQHPTTNIYAWQKDKNKTIQK
jgi:hypothetical protein